MEEAGANEGLRSRKKAQSRRDIERAMLELVLDRGYEDVTVGDVCERACVSKKTFFNYFPSKDAAVRGRFELTPSDDELAEALESDLKKNYIDVVVEAAQPDLTAELQEDPQVKELRQNVFAQSPQLLFRGHKDIAEMQAAIARALRTHLTRHPECRLLPGEPLSVEILAATSAVASVMRIRLVASIRDDRVPDVSEVRALLERIVGRGL